MTDLKEICKWFYCLGLNVQDASDEDKDKIFEQHQTLIDDYLKYH